MKPKEIRAAILLAEINITKLADRLNVSRSLVHKVIKGERANNLIREELAAALGKTVPEIWPEAERS